MYEKIKQKIQTDALESRESSQKSKNGVVRSYKDEGIRNNRRKRQKEDPDFMKNGFGGFSYQDDILTYGRKDSGENVCDEENGKAKREASSISGTRKVQKDLEKTSTGRVKHRARGNHREGRLKLDKALDQDPIIRKSLQSEGYYRRHRQKARGGNNVSVPSSVSQSKTPKEGSLARKKKSTKKRAPAFQHIPLSFMNTATPKPKHNESNERRSSAKSKLDNGNFYVVENKNPSPEFNYKEESRHSKSSNSKLKQESSRLELDCYLLNGTMQSTMKTTGEGRSSADKTRKKNMRGENILRSYGHNEYHNISKVSHNGTFTLKEESKVQISSRFKKDPTLDQNESKLMTKNSKKRDSEEHSNLISESFSNLKKTAQFMKANKSSKNFDLRNNISSDAQKREIRQSNTRKSQKENQSDMIQLSPSLQTNNKISASYNDYYKPANKSRLLKQVSKLMALDEAEEFYLQNNSELYNQIRNNNFDHNKNRKKKRTSSSGMRKSTHEEEAEKRARNDKKNSLMLDIENLGNPKLTNTHYPKTSTNYLPPQHPHNLQNFPNSTKNSRQKKPSRNSTDSQKATPLCLLSLNQQNNIKEEYLKEKKRLRREKNSSVKRKPRLDIDNYKQYTESFVELEDGTRNYQIREYQKTDSSEKREKREKRDSKSKSKKRHKKGSSSFGGFGQLYETYGDKLYKDREKEFEKKYRKMKIMASRDVSHPKSKENLLNFGGAQWK